jgi:hypothetical protein
MVARFIVSPLRASGESFWVVACKGRRVSASSAALFLEKGVGRSLRRALPVARGFEARDLRAKRRNALLQLGNRDFIELLPDLVLRLLPGFVVWIFRHLDRLKDIRASRRRKG